jgi:hypothetical protein
LCDAYQELGACTVSFDESGPDVGKWFIGCVEEELGSLTMVVRGLMGYSALLTHEGTQNALACEGCCTLSRSGTLTRTSSEVCMLLRVIV